MIKLTALTILVGAALAIPASALETWNFSTGCANNSASCNFTGTGIPSGNTVTVTAYKTSSTTGTLYSSSGLGVNTSTCEVSATCYLLLDFTNVTNFNSSTVITLDFGDTPIPTVVDQKTSLSTPLAGSGWSAVTTVANSNPDYYSFKYTPGDNFIAIQLPTGQSSSSSVLLTGMTAATPEPGYYLLLGLGLTSLVMFRRRATRPETKSEA